MDIAGSMNITFKADIAALVAHRLSAVLGDPAGLERRRHRRRAGADGASRGTSGSSSGATTSPTSPRSSTTRPPIKIVPGAARYCPTWTSRSPAPACGASTRCTRRRCTRAGCSAPATRCTGIRRPTGWAPTPRSRTRTTSPGSSPPCCGGQADPRCSTLTPTSGRRSPSGSCERANKSGSRVRRLLRGARHARCRAIPERWRPHRGAQGRHRGGRGQAGRAGGRPWS